jgi:hypothetical protein
MTSKDLNISITCSEGYREEVSDYKQDGNTLTIPFRAGDRDIEIFGSHVIPEFGTIATVLTLSVVMTLLISTKFPRVFNI